jgi:hypothetical protein
MCFVVPYREYVSHYSFLSRDRGRVRHGRSGHLTRTSACSRLLDSVNCQGVHHSIQESFSLLARERFTVQMKLLDSGLMADMDTPGMLIRQDEVPFSVKFVIRLDSHRVHVCPQALIDSTLDLFCLSQVKMLLLSPGKNIYFWIKIYSSNPF